MKFSQVSSAAILVAATAFTNVASASCAGTQTTVKNPDGTTSVVFTPGTCPPPVYNPIPSPTPTGPTNNGGAGGAGGAGGNGGAGGTGGAGGAGGDAAAAAAAQAAAIAKAQADAKAEATATAANKNDIDVKNTATGGTALAAGGSAKAEGGSAKAEGGAGGAAKSEVAASNNSTYSNTTTYKAAAAGATAIATGTMASGLCSQSEGGWAFGAQAVLWGASVSRNSGTAYKLEDVTFTDADGTTRVEKRNVCAADMAAFKIMEQGQSPNATKGEKKVAYAVGMEMSPVVDMAVRRAKNDDALSGLFDDEVNPKGRGVAAAPAPASITNQYNTTIVDAAKGTVTTFTCPKGTTLVVGKDGAPVISNGQFACQPG